MKRSVVCLQKQPVASVTSREFLPEHGETGEIIVITYRVDGKIAC